MKLKIKSTIIILAIISAVTTGRSFAEDNLSGLTFNVTAGPSYPLGFYKDYFDDGYNAGFNAYYILPLYFCNIYFKSGLSVYSYKMKKSGGSSLKEYDIPAGSGLVLSPFSFIYFFAGVDLHGIYITLDTDNTGGVERAFKPGVSCNFGAMANLGRGIGLSIFADYRGFELSANRFSAVNVSAGLTYNYNSYLNEQEMASRSEKKLSMFNQGIAELNRQNFDQAKTLFIELNALDRNYPGLADYLNKISMIEKNCKNADRFISQQNYLKAIPYLEECSPYMKDCEQKLAAHRKNLMVNVPEWETEGVGYYEAKRYKDCIEVMEKILLVDPENQNANIYLPRALKRQKAIESLKGG